MKKIIVCIVLEGNIQYVIIIYNTEFILEGILSVITVCLLISYFQRLSLSTDVCSLFSVGAVCGRTAVIVRVALPVLSRTRGNPTDYNNYSAS